MVSAAMERENALIEEQRQLIVRRRQPGPGRARGAGAGAGLPASHTSSLPDPTLGNRVDRVPAAGGDDASVAAVSAGP
jgi:hypothetical protein